MQQLKRLLIDYLLLVSLAIALSACGGGGGGGATTPANNGSGSSTPAAGTHTNWGQLIWDQDNWA